MSSENNIEEIQFKLLNERVLSTGEPRPCEYVTLLQSYIYTCSAPLNKYKVHICDKTDVSKQWKSQDLQWNETSQLISEEDYKSDIRVTSIGFEYLYSLFYMIPFVAQKSSNSPSLYRSLTWP